MGEGSREVRRGGRALRAVGDFCIEAALNIEASLNRRRVGGGGL